MSLKLKEKKGITLIALVITIVIILLVAVGIFIVINSKNTNEIKNSNNYSKDENRNSNNDLSINNSTYDSNFLEKVDDFEELEGKIIDMKNSGNDLYVSTINKVYRYKYSKFEEVLESTKSIKCIFLIGYDTVILQNSDNSYSIYAKDDKSSDTGMSSLYKELEGIEIENIIYAMDSDNSNKFILIREYDEGYYVDMYELDNNKNVKSKELKIPLHLSLGMNNSKEVNNIKQIYVKNESKLIFTLSDGKVYETGLSISFSDISNGYIKLYMEGTDVENLNNVNKVYTEGSTFKYGRPMFEKLGDKNNLYTYNSKVSDSFVGNPDEQYKISIPLPNGYTTDDIKNVIFDEDLIIEFNDNNIYVSNSNNLSNLLYNENLSLLNKSSKIKKIDLKSSEFIVLMDDNCIYEIDF